MYVLDINVKILISRVICVHIIVCLWTLSVSKQVRGEDADDPTNYLVVFGESEARYMVIEKNRRGLFRYFVAVKGTDMGQNG